MQRLAVIALAVVLAAACGGNDDSPPDDPRDRPTSSTTTPSTTASVESQVEAAYDAYKRMRRRLLEMPEPDDPEIPRRSAGPARDRLVDSLTTLSAQNAAVRFGPDYAYRVTSVEVSSRSAVLRECFVDDADVVSASTGEPIRPADVATVLNRITLEDSRGGWRVSDIVQEAGWEGVTDCAG